MLILTLVYTIVNGYNNKILLLSVFWMHVFRLVCMQAFYRDAYVTQNR